MRNTMVKRWATALLALAMLLGAACALADYPLTLRDQAGREVIVEAQPERIVSGYYISTSACIALGLEEKMVAVEAKANTRNIYALAAPELANLPSVGTAKAFDLETCLAQEPDLVILPKRLGDAAEALAQFGVPVLLVNPEDDALMQEMILLIGEASGEAERAQALCAYIAEQLELAAQATAACDRPTALVLGTGDYLTCAPGDMFQSTVLGKAGAVNAAQEMSGGSWCTLGYEQLLALNPDVLVIPAEAAYTAQDVRADPELSSLEAVRSGAVYAMPTAFEAWDSPTPSGVLGALWLAKTLHPEAYAPEMYMDAATTLYETYYGFTPDGAQL